MKKLSLFKRRDEKTLDDHLRNGVLEVFSAFVWLYAICKIFLFDVDIWIVTAIAPGYEWILSFKLIYFLGLASLLWFWIGARDAIFWVLYIFFYPLIILFIRVPYFVIKQESWLLAFAILNGVASFFRSFRYSLAFATLFLASLAVAVFASAVPMLVVASALLIFLVFLQYARSFWKALKPSVVFQIYTKFFKGVRNIGRSSFALGDEIKGLPAARLTDSQLQKWNTNLQSSVLFNRACIFSANKLRDYQKSEWKILPALLGLLSLGIFNVVTFSAVYYALYKMDYAAFRITEGVSEFTFIYFSFSNFILNSIPEMSPAAPISQVAHMLQSFLSFLLPAILITLWISHKSEKSSSELDDVICALQSEAADMEAFIAEEYAVSSIDMAIERLKEMKSGLVQLIYFLSR